MVVSIGTRREQWQAEQKKGKVFTMIKIYYTNLGLYNEGILAGEWVELPISDEELEEVRSRCGFDETHEEYFITDYESDVNGLTVDEYADLDELNELAELIEDDPEAVEALIYFGYDTAEEIAEHKDDLIWIDAKDDYDIGYYYAIECGCLDIPDNIQNYFDFDAYGRDIVLEGCFYFADTGCYELAA